MKSSTKKRLAILLAAVLALGVAVMPASAAPTSTGDIKFNAPTDPLKLTSVPAFKFGTHPISTTDEVYIITGAGSLTGTISSFGDQALTSLINVQDARGLGPADGGWNVSVALSNFTDSTSATSLANTVLTLDSGTVAYVSGGAAPVTVPAPSISLTTGGAGVKYVDAPNGAGGSWNITPPDASLSVKAAAMALGSHTATLTWTLSDTP